MSNDSQNQFTRIALELGFVTPEQIEACTRRQAQRVRDGESEIQLREIMLAKGVLTQAQAIEIMKRQAAGVTDARFIDGFRVLEELGRGATGIIYRATQLSLDREVALKVLSKQYARNEKLRERFLREARTVGRLRHPNIVQGIDVGSDEDTYYMAMEYIDGPTIGELVRRGGAMDERRALRILVQVAEALEYAHRNKIMHRDIKPDNIMLTTDGVAKLCDLGLARVDGDREDEKAATRRGTAIGTPHYIAPEQIRGDLEVDVRGDIYSLGATFYHMITGTPPYPGNSAVRVIARHLSEPLEPPRRRNPLVSEDVSRIIIKMMQKDPADRYADPKALLEDLKALAEGKRPRSVKATEARRRRLGTKFRGRRQLGRAGRPARKRRR